MAAMLQLKEKFSTQNNRPQMFHCSKGEHRRVATSLIEDFLFCQQYRFDRQAYVLLICTWHTPATIALPLEHSYWPPSWNLWIGRSAFKYSYYLHNSKGETDKKHEKKPREKQGETNDASRVLLFMAHSHTDTHTHGKLLEGNGKPQHMCPTYTHTHRYR